LTNHHLQ